MKELHESCSWSVIRSIHKLITDMCPFTAGSDPFPPLLVSHMCWLNVACSVVDVCVKLQMQSVTTSDKHCTETTSSAIEFRCNWTYVFQLTVCCKANYEISLAWKRQQNLWHATDSSMELLNWIGVWNKYWIRTDCEIFRHYLVLCSLKFDVSYICKVNLKIA